MATRHERSDEPSEETESIQSLIFSSPTLARDAPPSFLIQPSASTILRLNAATPVTPEAVQPATPEDDRLAIPGADDTEEAQEEVQPAQSSTEPTIEEIRSMVAEAAERRRQQIQEEIRAHLEESLRAEAFILSSDV